MRWAIVVVTMARPKEPRWIEIGTVAVRTESILVAARIARKVKRTRQRGTIDGVEYMCLTRFRAGER